jgi:integrase
MTEILAEAIGLGIMDEDDSSGKLFDGLCDEYLQFSKAHKTAHSYRRDQVSIKNLLESLSGHRVSKISAHEIERYKNARRKKVSAATVNRELSCIKHMFNKAVQWNYLPENPLQAVAKFKEPPGRVRYLSEDEIGRLLNCCASSLRPIIVMALNTGMRKGEIMNLLWSDVDLKNRLILVRNSKNNESRHVPINDTLYSELNKLREGYRSDKPVFTWKNGKPIKSIHNAFYRTMERARISNFRFHDLRHTFASYLAMKGVDIRVIQQLLGQKTIAMTMRYSHLSNKTLRTAVDKLSLTERVDE